MSVNMNTATLEELKSIPGIGDKRAENLIRFREKYGVVKKEALDLLLGDFSETVTDIIDFSDPRTDRESNNFDSDEEKLHTTRHHSLSSLPTTKDVADLYSSLLQVWKDMMADLTAQISSLPPVPRDASLIKMEPAPSTPTTLLKDLHLQSSRPGAMSKSPYHLGTRPTSFRVAVTGHPIARSADIPDDTSAKGSKDRLPSSKKRSGSKDRIDRKHHRNSHKSKPGRKSSSSSSASDDRSSRSVSSDRSNSTTRSTRSSFKNKKGGRHSTSNLSSHRSKHHGHSTRVTVRSSSSSGSRSSSSSSSSRSRSRKNKSSRKNTRSLRDSSSLDDSSSESVVEEKTGDQEQICMGFSSGDQLVAREQNQMWDPGGKVFPMEDAVSEAGIGLLDCNQAVSDTSLLDSVVTVDNMGLCGTKSHFDIVTHTNGASEICVCSVKAAKESVVGQPSCWGFTFSEIADEQGKDMDLQIIRAWLKDGKAPDEGSLFLASPGAKYYWLNRELFLLINAVVFKRKLDSKDVELVVPAGLQEQAMQWHHDIPSAGHQGVVRTKAKLKEKFFWVYTRK